MEIIRPSADLRNRYAEISKTCRETRKPVYITVNGRGDWLMQVAIARSVFGHYTLGKTASR